MVCAHLKLVVMNSNEDLSEQCFIILHPCSAIQMVTQRKYHLSVSRIT